MTTEAPTEFDGISKRALDLVLSIVGLALLFPLFCLIAVLIKLGSPGPVFFRQKRVGLGGNTFDILKFRSMQLGAETQGGLTTDDDVRVTRIGYFLRRYKLDELPQLINVITGEMSLIGPRPELEEFFHLYPESAQRVMISLRPGMTGPGLALLNESEVIGRARAAQRIYIDELIPLKARYIVDYAAHRSLRRDIGLIFRTLQEVAKLVIADATAALSKDKSANQG